MQLKIRPTKIQYYIRFIKQKGFSSDQILQGTNLEEAELNNPRFLIDIGKYIRIVINLRNLLPSPTLAFDLGENLTIGDLGIFGYTMMSSETTQASDQIYFKYSSLFFGNLIDVKVTTQNNDYRALYAINIDSEIREDLLQFLIEERVNLDIARYRLHGLASQPFPVESLSVTYTPKYDESAQLLTKLIGAPVYFAQNSNFYRLKAHSMSLALPGWDRETHEHCKQLLDEIYDNFHSLELNSNRVRNILFANLADLPTIDDVAQKMFVSKRTLNRRLKTEGTTFAQMVNDTRLEAIINYIVTTDMSHQAISRKLGFSNASSLRRFFKSRTGKTISGYLDEIF